MIYLLTAIGLTPSGSSTVHTQKQHTEQHNGTEYRCIFKDQDVQEDLKVLNLEDGTNSLSRNVRNLLPISAP
jgi:uncharacterized protein YceK